LDVKIRSKSSRQTSKQWQWCAMFVWGRLLCSRLRHYVTQISAKLWFFSLLHGMNVKNKCICVKNKNPKVCLFDSEKITWVNCNTCISTVEDGNTPSLTHMKNTLLSGPVSQAFYDCSIKTLIYKYVNTFFKKWTRRMEKKNLSVSNNCTIFYTGYHSEITLYRLHTKSIYSG